MFRKKRCRNCNEKVNESYNFCPYCRTPLNDPSDKNDFGLLGKNDYERDVDESPNIFGGIGAGIFGKMINNTMKMLEKEMQKGIREQKSSPPSFRTNMRLMVNGKEIDLNGNKVQTQKKEKQEKIILPQANARKFAGIPKANPKTNIRRLSDKVIYEINIPGVKSIEDISIAQLENSIEVKALGKDKVFQKIIPINLPIKNYEFSKRKLTLELEAKD